MKITCGVFIINSDKRVLLTHPTNHPITFWSIPKGGLDEGEKLIEAAIREVWEETNLKLSVTLVKDLKDAEGNDFVIYNKTKKKLKAFYYESTIDISKVSIICNSLVYRKGKDKEPFPENDKHGWADYKQARKLLHYSQIPFLDSLYKQNLIN